MATRIVLVSLLLSLLMACDKKEDDNNPGKDYTGTLSLTYSRSFPTFEAAVSIDADIAANGDVILGNPQQVPYDGVSEKLIEGERIKIREQGDIVITSLSGKWSRSDGKDYLTVTIDYRLEGLLTVSSFDEYQWITLSRQPYTLENPVGNPMVFRIQSALMAEAVCGATCSDCWGYSCFRWRLKLTPKT
ncbi:MAG: hypothetical protein IPN08_01610 [Bacteroidales bacterium]|nr:hypothetical protein [Bacteroidales bacterium]MBK9356084.1 hypothetical protein [Bacteroidales bacterium]